MLWGRGSGCELDAGGAELVCKVLGQLTRLQTLDVRWGGSMMWGWMGLQIVRTRTVLLSPEILQVPGSVSAGCVAGILTLGIERAQ